MKRLYIAVTTYVPKGTDCTLMEAKDKLLPSVAPIFNHPEYSTTLMITINNSEDEDIVVRTKDYIRKYIPEGSQVVIMPTTRNSLTIARNSMTRKAHLTSDSYIMFMDDDDRILPSAEKSIRIIMRNIHRPEFQDRLNFYMFVWERADGDFFMPKDILSKTPDKLGNSTFTFSSWGWIANVSYLINNNILWPSFLESPKLEDNYFHLRSFLVNQKANFILTPIYVWNNRDNRSSMSNGRREFIDQFMEYLKVGSVGYQMTPYFIRGEEVVEAKNLKGLSYSDDSIGGFLIKGLGILNKSQVSYDPVEMCYQYNNRRLKNLIKVDDFMRENSTFQLRVLTNCEVNDFDEVYKKSTVGSTSSYNGKANYDQEFANWVIAEMD